MVSPVSEIDKVSNDDELNVFIPDSYLSCYDGAPLWLSYIKYCNAIQLFAQMSRIEKVSKDDELNVFIPDSYLSCYDGAPQWLSHIKYCKADHCLTSVAHIDRTRGDHECLIPYLTSIISQWVCPMRERSNAL